MEIERATPGFQIQIEFLFFLPSQADTGLIRQILLYTLVHLHVYIRNMIVVRFVYKMVFTYKPGLKTTSRLR
jgi:hypothetical protein